MIRNAWTDEDNAKLQDLVARGVSMARAAINFGRNITAVRKQARKIDSPFRVAPVKRSSAVPPRPSAE